jgi:hypothetical protein
MGDVTDQLVLSGGGSVTVATDDMLADLHSMAAISSALSTVRTQLAIADSTFTQSALAMTQVGSARAAMEDAWIAMTEAKDIADYVSDSLVIAMQNYTEAEINAQWLAMGFDTVLSFVLGSAINVTPGVRAWLGTRFPWMIQAGFEGEQEEIGASDVEVNSLTNALLVDEHTIAMIRRLAMTGEAFVNGLGGLPPEVQSRIESMGVSGAAMSAGLVMMLAQQAGMLTETGVKVKETAHYERPDSTNSTLDRIGGIPDPAKRADEAQIRIDEIHDGDTVRYEVFIAGTADFNPISKTEAFDFTSNVAGAAGQSPASYRAVELAMEQAGITADDAVSFVGYSQGGLVASMLAASGDYNTKGLTTIGSPAGQIIIPPEVNALIIEHYEDLVPALGGTQANVDATIVRRHAFSEASPADMSLPIPGHQLQYYLETAELIDSAESEMLQSTVDELNAFSAGDSITSTWYHAERVP